MPCSLAGTGWPWAVRGDRSREHVAVRRVHDGKTLRYPLPALESSTATELWTVGDVLVLERIDGLIQRVMIPTAPRHPRAARTLSRNEGGVTAYRGSFTW